MTQRVLVNAILAAHYVKTAYGLVIAPATVRSWASRGRIGNYHTDDEDAHFDLSEIDSYIRNRLGLGDVAL